MECYFLLVEIKLVYDNLQWNTRMPDGSLRSQYYVIKNCNNLDSISKKKYCFTLTYSRGGKIYDN